MNLLGFRIANSLPTLLFLYFIQGPVVSTKTICVELVATFSQASPDGVRKEIITINGQFPGPTIRAAKGDTLNIRVRNRLIDSSGVRHPTSVHFHGIEMKHTPWFDGPEQVAQCPIPYNNYMDYSFKLVQSGTYWYHSHHSWQYIDGFWGLLIVDNLPNEVHAYDDEFSVTLMDWAHRTGGVLSNILNSPQTDENPELGHPPLPDSALINGRGNANCTKALARNLTCEQDKASSITVFRVVPGRTYRIRVVNPSAFASFRFSIDNHKLRVIEVDGVDTVETAPVDVVTIWPAQRYSFLVTMDWNWQFNMFGGNVWMRAELVIDGPRLISVTAPYAALHYIGSIPPRRSINSFQKTNFRGFDKTFDLGLAKLDEIPDLFEIKGSSGGGSQGRPLTTNASSSDDMFLNTPQLNNRPTFLKPFSAVKPESQPQSTNIQSLNCRTIGFTRLTENRGTNEISLNKDFFAVGSASQQNPTILDQADCKSVRTARILSPAPQSFDEEYVLNATFRVENNFLRAYMNDISYNSEESQIPVIFRAILNLPVPESFVPIHTPQLERVVQLVINNLNGGGHPWHLHGHTFWVMATGEEGDGPYDPSKHSWKLNLNSGLRRDTTHTPKNSWTVVRFETGNPGAWLLHCHIHWHLEIGLGAVFIEGQHELRTNYRVPNEARRVCRRNGVIIPTIRV